MAFGSKMIDWKEHVAIHRYPLLELDLRYRAVVVMTQKPQEIFGLV